MESSRAHHVVILGCGRSGTSIFGELFDQLTSFTYYSEPLFEELPNFDYRHPVAMKVPRESPGWEPSPGLPFPLASLLAVVPDPKTLFWQVRHPLDTVCSLRVGIADNWGHHPKPPDWEEWLQRPLLERCAHHWSYINSVGFRQVEQLARVTRFESMLSDARKFAGAICRRIGLDAEQQASQLEEWSMRVQNTNNTDFIEAQCSRPYSRPDHEVRVERWKENLSEAEVGTIVPILQAAAGRFGYQI